MRSKKTHRPISDVSKSRSRVDEYIPGDKGRCGRKLQQKLKMLAANGSATRRRAWIYSRNWARRTRRNWREILEGKGGALRVSCRPFEAILRSCEYTGTWREPREPRGNCSPRGTQTTRRYHRSRQHQWNICHQEVQWNLGRGSRHFILAQCPSPTFCRIERVGSCVALPLETGGDEQERVEEKAVERWRGRREWWPRRFLFLCLSSFRFKLQRGSCTWIFLFDQVMAYAIERRAFYPWTGYRNEAG